MKLSRLQVFGFKSFAKKLDLKLTGGITAIVGPNGCGKTNIVDAIRWVLGEQRPTQIRLERMEDILFKGSAGKSPLGMSEVSLTIDNNSGIIPVDIPEITITRRLFRSGESDYLINKKSCRLTDINDMLMDTGMGIDSYSVFEQSMINSILSDKTEDRRHIFEEAAGVTKYKARRRSALNKLVSIEDDLNRVGDIITELQRRVNYLNRQASKAKRYRNIKSEIKSKTLVIASFEIGNHKNKISEITEKLQKLQYSIESTKLRISNITAEIERISVDSVDVEKELEKIAGFFNASIGKISEKEKELARLDSRLESLGEMITRAREQEKKDSTGLEDLAESHGTCAGNLADVTERLEKVEGSYSGKVKEFGEISEEVARKADQYKRLEKEYRDVEQEIASFRTTLTNAKAKREESERRLGEISERTKELEALLATLNKNLADFEEQKGS